MDAFVITLHIWYQEDEQTTVRFFSRYFTIHNKKVIVRIQISNFYN